MKRFIRLFSVLALGSVFGLQSALGQEGRPRPFYFHVDLGGTVADDVKLEKFVTSVQGAEVDFNAGLRFDLAAGYEVVPWVAFELQTGFSALFIDRFKGMPQVQVHDSSFSIVPMLVNVRLQYPNPSGFMPFVGAGVGGAISSFYADDITDYQNYVVDGADSDAVFAWQAFAGLRYRINDKMSAGLVYKYMFTKGASWDVDSYWWGPTGEIALDDVTTHSASAFFSMQF